MAIVRWNPRSELDWFGRDPFFRRFFELAEEDLGGNDRTWHPLMDLVEEKDRLEVRLELPGIDPKDVQIQLQGDTLTVQGERKLDQENGAGKFLKREQVYGTFARSLQLPYRVQSDKVRAAYRNGVMTITLPKAEEHVGRQIPVEVK